MICFEALAVNGNIEQEQLALSLPSYRGSFEGKIKQPPECYDKKPFSKNEAERLCLQEPLVNGNQNLNLKGKPHGHNLSPVKGVVIPMSPLQAKWSPRTKRGLQLHSWIVPDLKSALKCGEWKTPPPLLRYMSLAQLDKRLWISSVSLQNNPNDPPEMKT